MKSQEKYAILSRVIFMKKEQIKGSVMLLFATLIWGSAFVAQSVGMDHLGPMSFQAVRSLLAVAAMAVMSAAGEKAAAQARGNGSMQMHFLDELYNLTEL